MSATLSERLRDMARTLERHGWLREEGERPVYWIEKAADTIDSLKKDAARYRWLSAQLTHQRSGPTTGWGTDVLYPGDDVDAAIDAAIDAAHASAGEAG